MAYSHIAGVDSRIREIRLPKDNYNREWLVIGSGYSQAYVVREGSIYGETRPVPFGIRLA